MPRGLGKHGRRFWRNTIPRLAELGLIDADADAPKLELLAQHYELSQSAWETAQREGFFRLDENKVTRRHPALQVHSDSAAAFRMLASEFGIGALPRERLGVVAGEAAGLSLDALLKAWSTICNPRRTPICNPFRPTNCNPTSGSKTPALIAEPTLTPRPFPVHPEELTMPPTAPPPPKSPPPREAARELRPPAGYPELCDFCFSVHPALAVGTVQDDVELLGICAECAGATGLDVNRDAAPR